MNSPVTPAGLLHPPYARCADGRDISRSVQVDLRHWREQACVVSSSVTGNTWRVGEALAGGILPHVAPAAAQALAGRRVLALGFWVRRGLPDEESRRFWQQLRGRQVFLFGTLGAWPDSPHAQRCLEQARELLAEGGNHLLGEFLCQGRVRPRQDMPGRGHPMTEARAARLAEAAHHPDERDCELARTCWLAALDSLTARNPVPAPGEWRCGNAGEIAYGRCLL